MKYTSMKNTSLKPILPVSYVNAAWCSNQGGAAGVGEKSHNPTFGKF